MQFNGLQGQKNYQIIKDNRLMGTQNGKDESNVGALVPTKNSLKIDTSQIDIPEKFERLTDRQKTYAEAYLMTYDPIYASRTAGYSDKSDNKAPLQSQKVQNYIRFLSEKLSESAPLPTKERLALRLAKRIFDPVDPPSDRNLKGLVKELREILEIGSSSKPDTVKIELPDVYYEKFGFERQIEEAEEAEIIEDKPDKTD